MDTLIVTAKLDDVDPRAWLADVLARIADLPHTRVHEHLPWSWKAVRHRDPGRMGRLPPRVPSVARDARARFAPVRDGTRGTAELGAGGPVSPHIHRICMQFAEYQSTS